ncbi:RDD family protein [Flavivirga aquimarina]|uniref:RDD family protein n=1 Tax=Flavivirga aquimarina TaxID=2027862 RepID=A0ABT8WDN7_9FLAO|nr:RDD family protein [Flavivirga aquimarina]MDO5971206.1 RDD family protein [Flavivirga aquimarina]
MFEEFEEENKIEIAQKRYRVLAFLIDFFVFWLIGMVLGMFFGTPNEDELGFSLNGMPALVLFLCGFFLWPISEGVFGQTLGKRLMKIKVVSNSNAQINMGQALVRFFFGFIDYIFLIGLIIASTDKNNRRIGDMVANTLVCKKNN